MAKVETDVMYFKDDVGKNLYRKKTYYTLVVEQDVLAKDKDEADTLFTDHGGIKYSAINKDRAGLNIKAKLEEISDNDPIKPGVFVEVVIQGLTIGESFLVDENSIYEDTFIYVLEGNKAVRTKINVEGFAKEKVIITGKKLNNKKIILTRINNLNLFKKINSKN